MNDNEYREFRRGILFALLRLPVHGGEFEDIVAQAGGFDELMEVANTAERELLIEARSLLQDEN
jgi:hypothetical protein